MIEASKALDVLKILAGAISFRQIGVVQLMAFCNDRTIQMVAMGPTIDAALEVMLGKIETGKNTISARLRTLLGAYKKQRRVELEKVRGNEDDPKIILIDLNIDLLETQLNIVDPKEG